jgi:hypothetical protein
LIFHISKYVLLQELWFVRQRVLPQHALNCVSRINDFRSTWLSRELTFVWPEHKY